MVTIPKYSKSDAWLIFQAKTITKSHRYAQGLFQQINAIYAGIGHRRGTAAAVDEAAEYYED